MVTLAVDRPGAVVRWVDQMEVLLAVVLRMVTRAVETGEVRWAIQ